jgi:glycosyltransferase involved in cell wall biosynthesis
MPDARPPARTPSPAGPVDAVVIGRNEGARLTACLDSLQGAVRCIVYVDSGSTDDSLARARAAGARLVELDPARPFTAARARNAGLDALSQDDPATHVQLIDGDCTLQAGWIASARAFLDANPRAAVACGRRRERFPEASLYNRMCDWEWDTPVGPARACGGDALIRLAALRAIGGYSDEVIAAEDDEMCQRLRQAGWEIWRLDAEMSEHDAAIHRFGQWWRRSVRAGHGFAQVGDRHPGHFRAERLRMRLWGAALPALAAAGLAASPWVPAAVAGLYAMSFARMAVRLARRPVPARDALAAAGLVTLSKFANLQGEATYRWRRLRGQVTSIIEYK